MRGQQSRTTITQAAVALACGVDGVWFPTTGSYRPEPVETRGLFSRIQALV